jgi:broad specificity phosphatase PhoE
MAMILLVRHGQAAFGSENYDQLSERGRMQSRWLGEHLAMLGVKPSRVVAGSLRRQRDTAAELLLGMGWDGGQIEQDAGLDEYDGEALYRSHTGGADQRAHQQRDFRDYWRTFRQAMKLWSEGQLSNLPESWQDFGLRVRTAVDSATAGAAREDTVLLVSSGGAIGRLIADVMGAPASTAIELNLQFRNTGLCELIAGAGTLRLLSYNAIPHLDHPQRRDAVTFA